MFKITDTCEKSLSVDQLQLVMQFKKWTKFVNFSARFYP